VHSAPGERLESDAAAPCLAGPACAIIGALGRSPRPFSWPVLRSCACPARGLIRRFRGFERMLTSTSGMARGVALIVRAGLRLRIRFGRSRARGSFQSRNPPKKLLGRDLGINFGRSEGGSDPLARDRPEWLRMGRSGSRCDGALLPGRIQRSAGAAGIRHGSRTHDEPGPRQSGALRGRGQRRHRHGPRLRSARRPLRAISPPSVRIRSGRRFLGRLSLQMYCAMLRGCASLYRRYALHAGTSTAMTTAADRYVAPSPALPCMWRRCPAAARRWACRR